MGEARSDKTFMVFKLRIRYFKDNHFCVRRDLMALSFLACFLVLSSLAVKMACVM